MHNRDKGLPVHQAEVGGPRTPARIRTEFVQDHKAPTLEFQFRAPDKALDIGIREHQAGAHPAGTAGARRHLGIEAGAQDGAALPIGLPHRHYVGHLGRNLAGGGIAEPIGHKAAAERARGVHEAPPVHLAVHVGTVETVVGIARCRLAARVENAQAMGVNGKQVHGAVLPPGIVVEVVLGLCPAHVGHVLFRTAHEIGKCRPGLQGAQPANRHGIAVVVASSSQHRAGPQGDQGHRQHRPHREVGYCTLHGRSLADPC